MRKFSRILAGCAAAATSAVPAHAALVISSAPTSNVTCSGGVCSATAADAILNAGDLARALAHGSLDVESGSDAMDINVTASLSWTTHHTLTLTADRSIGLSAAMVAESAAARVVLVTGSGGDLTFPGGHLDFWSTHSHLTINGQAYKLAADIAGLAAAIAVHPKEAYALAKSYDAGPDGSYTQAPVPTTFMGKFEGLGHTVDHLTVSTSGTDAGLFAAASGASLRDIVLTNASIASTLGALKHSGALLGFGTNVAINHAAVSGSVSGDFAGGIVGEFSGSINDANSSATVAASDNIASLDGGLAGGIAGAMVMYSTISHSHATGIVSGSAAGGLVGYGYDAVITDSFATGNVTTSHWGGGLAANYEGNIQDSYATGNISSISTFADNAVGGLVGYGADTLIMNTYALGNVSTGATGFSGGLIGQAYSFTYFVAYIQHNYAAGTVSGGGAQQFGGFAGTIGQSMLRSDSWDTTTGGTAPAHGVGQCTGHGCKAITGLTTAQLQSGLPTDFDPAVWGSNPGINGGLPYLLALPPG
jgi:hypothetical protein